MKQNLSLITLNGTILKRSEKTRYLRMTETHGGIENDKITVRVGEAARKIHLLRSVRVHFGLTDSLILIQISRTMIYSADSYSIHLIL